MSDETASDIPEEIPSEENEAQDDPFVKLPIIILKGGEPKMIGTVEVLREMAEHHQEWSMAPVVDDEIGLMWLAIPDRELEAIQMIAEMPDISEIDKQREENMLSEDTRRARERASAQDN